MDPPVGTETLGDAARRARIDDGSNAAVELAIDSDDDATLGSDDLEDEIDTDAGAEEGRPARCSSSSRSAAAADFFERFPRSLRAPTRCAPARGESSPPFLLILER